MYKNRTTAAALLCAAVSVAAAQEADPLDALAGEEQAQPEAQPATSPQSGGAEPAQAGPAQIPVEPLREDAPSAAPPARKAGALEEVVVTAQRRSERLLDVPIAVSAFSADQIEARGIQRIDDLNSLAPGLQISRTVSNSTISQIAIRGSAQINPAIYWDPAVGLYLDGVYIGKSQGSIFDIVDLAGVEVLRGPQGTLYGRNTIGGTINLVTRAPSGELGGAAGIELGNYNARVGRASVDLPEIGFARIKLAGRSERRDGWVDTTDTSPVDEMNNRYNDAFLAAVDLDLWPGVLAAYRFDFSRTDQTNTFLQLYRSDNPTLQPSQQRETEADIDSESFERVRIEGHSLTLSWALNPTHTLKSISGYRKLDWDDSLDLDGSPQMIAHTQRYTDYDQVSQDLNLTGSTEHWKYVGGVYYFADDGYTDNPQTFYFGTLNFDSRYGTETEAWAGYGQIDWQPLEPLTLTAGYRYTRENKTLERVLGFSPVAGGPFAYYIPEGFTTPEATFSAGTPLASVAWAFNERMNVYLRYAEGFKSGGYNGEYSDITRTPEENQAETLVPFKPERQKSLELGAKGVFFDGRLSANLALFRNKLEDLQISIFTGGGAAASVIRNAGKGTAQGAELETVLLLFDRAQLRLSYAFLDAEYDEFIDTDAEGNVGNQADNRAFVHAPEHSANAVIDSLLWETARGGLRAVVDYAWTDAIYLYPYQLARPGEAGYNDQKQQADNTRVEAHGLLNARLSWSGLPLFGDAQLDVALWGRNLLDEDTASNFIDFGPGLFQNLTVANFVEPRSYGLSAQLRW